MNNPTWTAAAQHKKARLLRDAVRPVLDQSQQIKPSTRMLVGLAVWGLVFTVGGLVTALLVGR